MVSRKRIRDYIAATVKQNPEGIVIDDLWTLISHERAFAFDNLAKTDMGPIVGELRKAGRIEVRTWHYPDGRKLVLHPAPGLFAGLVCRWNGHVPFEKSAMEEGLALYAGGVCRRCTAYIQPGEALGDAWIPSDQGGDSQLDFSPAHKLGLRVLRI